MLGCSMLRFHLTRYWFDRFKNGFKAIEYRVANARNSRMLKKVLDKYGFSLSGVLCLLKCDIPCKLYCGYPKSTDLDRVLIGRVVMVKLVPLSCLPKVEEEFFIRSGIDDSKTLFYAFRVEF